MHKPAIWRRLTLYEIRTSKCRDMQISYRADFVVIAVEPNMWRRVMETGLVAECIP
jgi:hypothetical protein